MFESVLDIAWVCNKMPWSQFLAIAKFGFLIGKVVIGENRAKKVIFRGSTLKFLQGNWSSA